MKNVQLMLRDSLLVSCVHDWHSNSWRWKKCSSMTEETDPPNPRQRWKKSCTWTHHKHYSRRPTSSNCPRGDTGLHHQVALDYVRRSYSKTVKLDVQSCVWHHFHTSITNTDTSNLIKELKLFPVKRRRRNRGYEIKTIVTICLTKEYKILLKSAGMMYFAQFRYQY